MVVAIDGPAGVGKSTIAHMLAEKLHIYYLNSGSFYRAVTFEVEQAHQDPMNKEAVREMTKTMHITVKDGKVCNNGIDIESFLHTPEVDRYVAQVSVDPIIRSWVNNQIRQIAQGLDIIVEGRDITTIVFPDAEFKFYFDASAEVRAKRRFDQNPETQNYEKVLEGIKSRDKIDTEKAVGGLKLAKDAVLIDTSYLTISSVCAKVVATIQMHSNMQESRN